MFGEEKGGIPSKPGFLSSGKRGASRTKKNYQKTPIKLHQRKQVQKSPCVVLNRTVHLNLIKLYILYT